MLSEVSHTEKDKYTALFYSYIKPQKVDLIEIESRIVIARGWRE
jgi:hypothetical protein